MNNDLYSLSKRIAAQYDAIQRVVDRMNWHSKIIQPSIDMQDSFVALVQQQQRTGLLSYLHTMQGTLSVCQQLQKGTFAGASVLEASNAIQQQRMQLIQPNITRLIQLQDRLSQLTEQEFQLVQDEFEPSDELVESVNSTLHKANDLNDETAGMPCLFLSKSFIKENLIGILSLILTILFQLAPNAEHQKIISQNDQIIEQSQKTIELDERRNELLKDIANTVHLLSEDMNLPIDQEQTVAIESDEVIHSPTQDQDTDCHQENSD